MNQEFKGTSGEFIAVNYDGFYCIQNDSKYTGKDLLSYDTENSLPLSEVSANAQLFAASKQMMEVLQEMVGIEEVRLENGKAAADRHNNTPGVGQKFDYMSYPAEPYWLKKAKAALSAALD